MYVAPQSDIYLLRGVPLEPTYDHTLYFASESAQRQYFTNTAGIMQFTRQTYQRVNKGVLRIAQSANNLNNYNYMMFRNTREGTFPSSKWFYAFITSVEYVNESLTEITYEIDHLQTWLFEMVREQCYVDREHSITDVAGDNIVPEPVSFGEYYSTLASGTGLFDEYAAILVSPYFRMVHGEITDDETTVYPESQWLKSETFRAVDNQRVSLIFTVLRTSNALETALKELTAQGNKASEIVCLYTVPTAFLHYYDGTGNHEYANFSFLQGMTMGHRVHYYYDSTKPTTLGTYGAPKNKKLLTYPYNKFTLVTGEGMQRDYAFEFFQSHVSFYIWGTLLQSAAFRAVPDVYKGLSQNFNESAVIDTFPMMAYTVDTFKAWFAQNKTKVAIQAVSAVAGVGGGLGSVLAGAQMLTPKTKVLSKRGAKMIAEGSESMVQSVSDSAINLLNEAEAHIVNPLSAQGSIDGSLEIRMNIKDFIGYQMYVNPKEAKIIDDFFSLYGYATHTVKVPNIAARPHWTYTKTVGCKIGGNIPSEANEAICAIFNRGITFWRNPSEVGDYTLDNSPV